MSESNSDSRFRHDSLLHLWELSPDFDHRSIMISRPRVKKILQWSAGFAGIAAIGIQFANPSLKNPAVQPGRDLMATNPPPPEVARLIRSACYDCHSYETRWPWYAHVAPVSWWIVGHMKEGREAMNFSEWPHDNPDDAVEYLDEIVRDVQHHKMPLPSYTWMGMHPEAHLTEEQRGRILKWADLEAERLSQ